MNVKECNVGMLNEKDWEWEIVNEKDEMFADNRII